MHLRLANHAETVSRFFENMMCVVCGCDHCRSAVVWWRGEWDGQHMGKADCRVYLERAIRRYLSLHESRRFVWQVGRLSLRLVSFGGWSFLPSRKAAYVRMLLREVLQRSRRFYIALAACMCCLRQSAGYQRWRPRVVICHKSGVHPLRHIRRASGPNTR